MAVAGSAWMHACPRCTSRRWALSERGARLRGGCLGCGLVVEDLVGAAGPERVADPARPRLRWIGHAGLGAGHPDGTPTRASLDRAVLIGVDAVELDVCVTHDQELVLRHEVCLPGRRRVRDLSLTELRDRRPETLTLSEAVDQLDGKAEVLLDPKDPAATVSLGRWLRRRRHREHMMVCSSNRAVLLHLRDQAPRIERWQSLPAVGASRTGAVASVARSLARSLAAGRGGSVLSELGRGAVAAVDSPSAAAWHVVGSPWRRELPLLLDRLSAGVSPAGMTIDHRLISPELCSVARHRGLRLVAWTINAADHLARAVESGVRTVTTDRVVDMRLALDRLPAGVAPQA